MTIHKEGHRLILTIFIILALLGAGFYLVFPVFIYWHGLFYLALLLFFVWTVMFFRSPSRELTLDENTVVCPADGRIVVVEETREEEYFHAPMRKVSIFMSPLNVHLNRNPASGNILYFRYHSGKYLLAYNPKSSTLNERTSIAMETANGHPLMIRQVAGFLARRIVCYIRESNSVRQGSEFGFIKFGSRVDVYMPLDAEVLVRIGDKVKGGVTEMARFRDLAQETAGRITPREE
jgi:phosphatidylserine decarboxylase